MTAAAACQRLPGLAVGLVLRHWLCLTEYVRDYDTVTGTSAVTVGHRRAIRVMAALTRTQAGIQVTVTGVTVTVTARSQAWTAGDSEPGLAAAARRPAAAAP